MEGRVFCCGCCLRFNLHGIFFKMSESKLGKDLMIAWSKLGHRLFRMNSGMGWIGKSVRLPETTTLTLPAGTVVIYNARPLHTGFKGASDYWGFKRITITPEMVGQTIAQFAVMETKAPRGRPTTEQKNFIDMVNNLGGIGRVVRDLDDSLK